MRSITLTSGASALGTASAGDCTSGDMPSGLCQRRLPMSSSHGLRPSASRGMYGRQKRRARGTTQVPPASCRAGHAVPRVERAREPETPLRGTRAGGHAMPRKPTGRGRGRPLGSGQLGEEGTGHKRLTVRLPTELYDALEAVAEREHYTREAPELARTVRTALEHYLACPHRRQTGIVPHTSFAHNGQTGNALEALEENTRQTTIVPEPLEENRGLTENVPEPERTVDEPSDKKAADRKGASHG